MLEAVYTTQKTKKSKKWIDGFVEKNGIVLKLFNDERKQICSSSSFKLLEDSNIEMGVYLIYTDFLDQMDLSSKSISHGDENEVSRQRMPDKEEDKCCNKILETETTYLAEKKYKEKGRSSSEILNLLKDRENDE